MTYELAWKTLQDFLRDRGNPDIAGGPAVIIAKAIEEGYIKDEESWKELKKSREMTSHTYDEATANEIAGNIVEVYHSLFIQLETRLQLEKINQEKQG
jgi:nucleotidyltransferase substrate binding protein (TIGR01987 family)